MPLMESTETVQMPLPAQTLTYATLEPRERRRISAGAAMVIITFLIALAAVIIFMIICDSMRYRTASGEELWPAAVAVLGLSGMGAGFGFFLTRNR